MTHRTIRVPLRELCAGDRYRLEGVEVTRTGRRTAPAPPAVQFALELLLRDGVDWIQDEEPR